MKYLVDSLPIFYLGAYQYFPIVKCVVMSWRIFFGIFILILALFSLIVYSSNSGSKIVIYGYHGCPACNRLKDFFDTVGLPYEFREIYDCQLSGCRLSNYGHDLAEILEIADLEPYIPVSVVIDADGYVVAIVQGVIEDRGFWDQLLAIRFGYSVEVYSDGKVSKISDPESVSRIIKIVTNRSISLETIESFIEANNTITTTKPTTIASSNGENKIDWQLLILGITFAIIAVTLTIITIIRRR